jgi:hypothetical protein
VTDAVDETDAPPTRLARLEERAVIGPAVTAGRRFFAIEGLDLGGLIAVELFTTVMPLLLIGYAWFKDFSPRASIGELFVRQLGASGEDVLLIRRQFGSAAGLEQVWTVTGLAAFLIWGIPMSLTVVRMFAMAWGRAVPSLLQRLWRGALWFGLYLVDVAATEGILLLSVPRAAIPALVVAALAVSIVFWGITPVLLVPSVRFRLRTVVLAGLVGAVVNFLVLRIAARIAFPLLLSGWDGFGPIGVAMTLMTWCGVLGVTWVVSACAGAVFVERSRARSVGPLA